ncbi:MAG: hypothetical protein ACK4TA_01080 [Saprospiraceae bacterium]
MDSFWTQYSDYIVGIPAIVVSTAVAVWLFFKQKDIKRLSYIIRANENLLSYKKDLKKDLIILYKNQEIDNLFLLEIEFENMGNTPILKTDFDSNLKIIFRKTTSILSSEIGESFPKKLEISIKQLENQIEILPLLINPGDRFSLKFLLNENLRDVFFDIESRIAGVNKINITPQQKSPTNALLLSLSGIFIVISPLIFIVYSIIKGDVIGVVIFFIISIIVYFSIYMEIRRGANRLHGIKKPF